MTLTHAEAQPRRGAAFPKALLYGAGLMIAVSIGLAWFGKQTGFGVVSDDQGAPVAVRDLVISREAGDWVRVTDARSGAQLGAFAPNTGGFVRGSLRGLERMRLVSGVDPSQPYRLILWESGALSLSDTGAGQRMYLHAFGADNAKAFAAFLEDDGGR